MFDRSERVRRVSVRFAVNLCVLILLPDPFGGDPFKESDPFQISAPEDFFKKPEKSDPFVSDPFSKNPTLSSNKVRMLGGHCPARNLGRARGLQRLVKELKSSVVRVEP